MGPVGLLLGGSAGPLIQPRLAPSPPHPLTACTIPTTTVRCTPSAPAPAAPPHLQVQFFDRRLAEATSEGRAKALECEARQHELLLTRQQLEAAAGQLRRREGYLEKVEAGVIRPLNKWYQVGEAAGREETVKEHLAPINPLPRCLHSSQPLSPIPPISTHPHL